MATASLTTTAWVAHNLGVAAELGGSLFGKFALNPSVKKIGNEADRGKVLSKAWNGYNVVNAISLGTIATTWVVGRTKFNLSGKEVTSTARRLVLAKDVLVGAAVAVGIASGVGGVLFARQAPDGGTPVTSGTQPSSDTPKATATIQRTLDVLGNVNIFLIAGISAVTTILAMESGKSGRWSFISRFLP